MAMFVGRRWSNSSVDLDVHGTDWCRLYLTLTFLKQRVVTIFSGETRMNCSLIGRVVRGGNTDRRGVFLFHVRDGILKRKSQSIEIVATFEHRLSAMSIVKHGDVFQDHVNQFDLSSIDQSTNTDAWRDDKAILQLCRTSRSHVWGNVLDSGNQSPPEKNIQRAIRSFASLSLYFDGLLDVSIAENSNARHTAQDRPEIFEECSEEWHHFTRGNVQGSTDSITILRRLLVGIERIGEKLETGNFIGDRQPQRSKGFDSKWEGSVRETGLRRVTDFNPARICIALLKLPMYQQVTAHRTIEATIAFLSWKLVWETINCWMNEPTWTKNRTHPNLRHSKDLNSPLEIVEREFELICLEWKCRSAGEWKCPRSDVEGIAMVEHWERSRVRSPSVEWPLLRESQRDISILPDPRRNKSVDCDPSSADENSSALIQPTTSNACSASAAWDSECDRCWSLDSSEDCSARSCRDQWWFDKDSCLICWSEPRWEESSFDARWKNELEKNDATSNSRANVYRTEQSLRHWRSSRDRQWWHEGQRCYSIANAIWFCSGIPRPIHWCLPRDDVHWWSNVRDQQCVVLCRWFVSSDRSTRSSPTGCKEDDCPEQIKSLIQTPTERNKQTLRVDRLPWISLTT